MAMEEELRRKLESQDLLIAKQNDVIAVLQKIVDTLKAKQIQCSDEDDKRVCRLRLLNVEESINETNEDCLLKVKTVLRDARINIPEEAICDAYRDKENDTFNPRLIIVCCKPWNHGQTLYRARKQLRKKSGYSVQVHMTKEKYDILESVRQIGEENKKETGFQFAYANFNGVMFIKLNGKFEEFSSVDEAREKMGIIASDNDLSQLGTNVEGYRTDDELDDSFDNNMPFRQGRLLKSDECMKNTIYEQGFVLQSNYYEPSSFESGSQFFPMKRSVSCASCLLCESNTRMRGYDGVFGNGMKKVASCSMCVWDVEDNKWSEEDSNQLSSDEINNISSDELPVKSGDESDAPYSPFYRRRSSSYVYGLEGDKMDEYCYKGKSEKVYPVDLDELKINANYTDDMSISRTSPDGGESYIDDFVENRVKYTSTPELNVNGIRLNDTLGDTPNEDEIDITDNELNLSPQGERRLNEKQSKKIKTKRRISLDRKATEELDEIFGKIQRRKSTVYESDTDSVQNFMFRPISKSFSLTRSKKLNKRSRIKKCWSVEELCPKDDILTNGLYRSQSTFELTKIGSMQEEPVDNRSEVLRKIEDQKLYEKWLDYLERIGGASSLAGNKSLRYIWQQIMLYHDDLQQPLEEFLKTNLEKSQQLYTSYQELEEMLEQKAEQQEKETAKIYNDVEQAIQQEREQLQETFAEKEEVAKKETQKIIHAKEQEIETLVQLNTVLNDKIKQLECTNEEFKINKEKIDQQFATLTGAHTQLRRENDAMAEMNNALVEKINVYDLVLKEQEEIVTNVNKQCETTEEKFRETKQVNIGLSEENEFLKLNVSNLNAEIEELKAKNKLLNERSCTIPSHGHYVCNSDEEADEFYNNSYENEIATPIPPVHISPAMNSTFNSQYKNKNNKAATSLMEEVTPFLQERATPPPRNLTPRTSSFGNKSSLALPSRTSSTGARKNLNMMLSRNTTPTQIRLASNRQTDYKVIFTGDCNVGKTSLIRRICHGKFRSTREETIEPDFSTKELEYNDQKIKLKLWDTVGQERFNSIPPSYFRKSDIVILMYDIAEEVSFINAKSWIRTIHDYTNENIFILLVASKSDLHHKRMVPTKRGQELATNNDAMFIEASAKTGENVAKLCQMMASTLVAREETVFIRKDFETSLCSLSYSMSQSNRFNSNSCCT